MSCWSARGRGVTSAGRPREPVQVVTGLELETSWSRALGLEGEPGGRALRAPAVRGESGEVALRANPEPNKNSIESRYSLMHLNACVSEAGAHHTTEVLVLA